MASTPNDPHLPPEPIRIHPTRQKRGAPGSGKARRLALSSSGIRLRLYPFCHLAMIVGAMSLMGAYGLFAFAEIRSSREFVTVAGGLLLGGFMASCILRWLDARADEEHGPAPPPLRTTPERIERG